MQTQTPSDPDYSRQKPDIKLPEGYADEAAFLMEMRQDYSDDLMADKANRDAALEDLAFVTGNQWTDEVRARRLAAFKPVMTINRLQAFLAQVLGSRRLNETQIKFTEDMGGTKEVAQVREDLMRSIQKESRAESAYDNALMGCVACGIGNFEMALEYESNDVFEQAMRINPVMDHLGVIWDRRLIDPTGKDAKRCFVIDTMTRREFMQMYPWATPADIMQGTTLGAQMFAQGWYEAGDVRVVSYWVMRCEKRTLAMMQTGAVLDITDNDDPALLAQVAPRPDGSPYIREVDRPYAQKYICSGSDILEGPYNLPIDRIPVFRVPGWEIRLGQATYRYGLIRFLKDPQRLHNYFRSVLAEKLTQTPRAVWLAAKSAVAGLEVAYRNSHLSDDPLLMWNDESGAKPERIAPAQLEQALLQQAELTSQDIKDVSNIHEANLGMPSNEVSGVAIQARQRVSDTGTILYHANLASAIEECGRVGDQLFGVVYDTPRIVKTLGEDAKSKMQVINVLGNPDSIDITEGKYSVAVTTGPSYATKRIEEADAMFKMANAMPATFDVAADLIVEAQDWPLSKEISARLRRRIPPNLLGPEEQTPEAKAQQASAQQKQQFAEQLQAAAAAADIQNTQSQSQLNAAKAQNAQVQAALAPAHAQNEALKTASTVASQEVHDHVAVLKI